MPPRFLEIILNEMKQGGFVESRRGVQGGYLLLIDPKELSVGRVIRYVDGPFDPVDCLNRGGGRSKCPLTDRCALIELWLRAKRALEEVYDGTTFQVLLDREKVLQRAGADYCI